MKRIILLPPLVFLVTILLIWEVLSQLSILPRYLMPSPLDIARTLHGDWPMYQAALRQTVFATALGLSLSIAIGFSMAVLFSFSRLFLSAVYPFAIFFQTVPIIAIAPLLVVWFGYGVPSVVASAFIVSFFPMIASTLSGLSAADPALRDLFRLYGARRMKTLWKLLLPASLPQLFSGLRIVAGLAVIGTIVGELMGGVGLGSIIDVARTQQRLDQVFAAIALASLLGFVVVRGIDMIALRFRHIVPGQKW